MKEKLIFKELKNKNGITLVALVITIVILLILAGITIAMILDENGIIRQAQNAKMQTEIKRKEEENWIKYGSDFIAEEIGTGTNDGGMQLAELKEKASTYYGLTVEYTPSNSDLIGETTWKLFYVDNNHVYLIADDCVPRTSFPESKGGNLPEVYRGPDYSSAYYSIPNDYSGSAEIAAGYRYFNKSYYDYIDENNEGNEVTNKNIKVVAYMYDTTAWSSFLDSDGKGEFAIGGPSIEMVLNSYSEKSGSINGEGKYKYQARTSGLQGYEVSADYGNSWCDWELEEGGSTFYFNSETEGLYMCQKCNHYWISSPAVATNSYLFIGGNTGTIEIDDVGGPDLYDIGLRPVIALKSTSKLVPVKDGNGNVVSFTIE